jgi:hypothetical protein
MTDDGLVVHVPKAAPDTISSTVAVRVAGSPQIESVPIAQARDGSIALLAADARLHGKTLRYEIGGPLDDIGFWSDASEWIEWEFKVSSPAPARFTLAALIASPDSGTFDVTIGEKSLRCSGPVTANYTDFKLSLLGTIEITSPRPTTLAVRPVKDAWRPMNLKSIHLIPLHPPAAAAGASGTRNANGN